MYKSNKSFTAIVPVFNEEKFDLICKTFCSKKSEIQVINIKNRDELKNFLKKNLFDDEMVICMGAGSISNWIREIGTELQ